MNKEQEALNMLDQAVSQLQASRDIHLKLQQAVKTLQAYIDPQEKSQDTTK